STGVDDNGLLRSGLEPGERAGDARPQRRRARGVVDSFAVVAEAHVVGQASRQSFPAREIRGDVRIPLARLLEKLPGPRRVAFPTEDGQRSRVSKGGRGVILIGREQLVELLVALEREQPLGLAVANALVVVRVQAQEVALVVDGLLAPAERPERLRERRAGAHVRARLEDAPEVPDVLLEGFGTERPLAGGDALLEQLARLLGARRRLLREQQV